MLKSLQKYPWSYKPIGNSFESRTNNHDHQHMRKISWWIRLSPLWILVPTIISIYVLVLHQQQYKDTGKLYQWATTSRTSIQVVIQILSSLFAFLWTFSICTFLSHWTRHRVLDESVNLNTLRLWSAVTQARGDWSLSWMSFLVTLAFLTLTSIPATLWAGALTPALTQTSVPELSLLVPGSGPHGNYSSINKIDCWSVEQFNGTFTNCLQSLRTGNLLRSVATASSPNNLPMVHGRWDNTRLQYIGRSYGVGSAAGLTDRHIAELGKVQTYTYQEVGFQTEAHCLYNRSANITLEFWQERDRGSLPDLYMAVGALPNSRWRDILRPNKGDPFIGWDYYAQAGYENGSSIVSTFNRGPIDKIGQIPKEDRWMFGMRAGEQYAHLNNTQCEVKFKPSMFEVEVAVVNSTIKVSPIESKDVKDPDPTMRLRYKAFDSLGLSYVTTTLHTSSVGEAFLENTRNLQTRRMIETNVDDTKYSDLVLESVADSIIAVIDDSLVYLGSTSLTMSNATQRVNATARILAVQIGSKPFIWATCAINIAGLVFVFVGSCLLWQADVPVFDYRDLACMAFGIRQGVVVLNPSTRTAVPVTEDMPWNGDVRDARIGNLMASLNSQKGHDR